MRILSKLKSIYHNEPITTENHYDFLYLLQSALLLAMQESESLNPMQYRYAEDRMKKQRRERAKILLNTEHTDD